jgi:hypothetical protein
MKKVGIVADNYKLEMFKKKLNDDGFTDYEVFPFTKDTYAIKVNVPDDKVIEIKKICDFVETHFKRSN